MSKKKTKSITFKRKKKKVKDTRAYVNKGTKVPPENPPLKIVKDWQGNERVSVHNTWPEWGDKFLKAFREHKTIYHAAMKLGISRDAVTRYKRHCKEFKNAFYDAKEAITDMIEESAINRAINGVDKLVLYEGVPVKVMMPGMKKSQYLYERKYETSLSIFMLKGRRREEYYPEMKLGGGTTDDQANAVLQAIEEIQNIMAPGGK